MLVFLEGLFENHGEGVCMAFLVRLFYWSTHF